ncbi:MAG: M23 family metallopeptidase [Sphingopyxis sp.]
MTVQLGRFFKARLAIFAAAAALTLGAPAMATNANEAPVDLDAPDVDLDSQDAETAVANADAAAAAVVRFTPVLARRVGGEDDSQFRSLFTAWQQMDGPSSQAIAIPSRAPVDVVTLTSSFGTRSDPFNGRRARHNGIDIPRPTGTPIYATADGTIGRAQRLGGYGNYVEVEHGNAIQTRYGHMSVIGVVSGQRVRRGDIIGYVGSTGRSTGPHLHYEVRIAGAPVNPLPFLAEDGVMADASGHGNVALGGPRE